LTGEEVGSEASLKMTEVAVAKLRCPLETMEVDVAELLAQY
jgi:hypothetical protein